MEIVGKSSAAISSSNARVIENATLYGRKRELSISGRGSRSLEYEPKQGIAASEYIKTYTSYSGHDMVCTFQIPLRGGGVISQVVGEVQTISYSIHNEKMPVRVLGDMNMKNMVFGNRTIAGSLVFVVFNRHWAHKLIKDYLKSIKSSAHALMDEMPPFNITISMANEYGDVSRLALYGVSFVNEGQIMSIEDIYTENTYQFYAKDLDYLTNVINYNGSGAKNRGADLMQKPNNNEDDMSNAPIDAPTQNDGSDKKGNNDLVSTDFDVEYEVYSATKEHFTGVSYEDAMREINSRYEDVISEIEEKRQNLKLSRSMVNAKYESAHIAWINAREQTKKLYQDGAVP